jgi:hypothetical protein
MVGAKFRGTGIGAVLDYSKPGKVLFLKGLRNIMNFSVSVSDHQIEIQSKVFYHEMQF